jgi:hypothetical protein
LGTLTPCAWPAMIDAEALIPGFTRESLWLSAKVALYETTLLVVVPTVEIALTCAPSFTPVSASSVTVAGWPTFTLLTSDSLRATVIVIEPVLMISTNGEVELAEPVLDEDEELEPPRLPAAVPAEPLPVEAEDDPLPELADPDPLDVDPAETESPGDRFASETIVPLIGA